MLSIRLPSLTTRFLFLKREMVLTWVPSQIGLSDFLCFVLSWFAVGVCMRVKGGWHRLNDITDNGRL